MAFQFSLETVLRVRKIAEDREERLLTQILQQMTECRQNLADLALRRANLLLERERLLEAKISAAELIFLHAQTRVVEGLEESGKQHLAGLEKLRTQQMRVYETAYGKRKLLATMREQQLDSFRAEQARAEQKEMDDRFASASARHGLPGKVGNDCLGLPGTPSEPRLPLLSRPGK